MDMYGNNFTRGNAIMKELSDLELAIMRLENLALYLEMQTRKIDGQPQQDMREDARAIRLVLAELNVLREDI